MNCIGSLAIYSASRRRRLQLWIRLGEIPKALDTPTIVAPGSSHRPVAGMALILGITAS